MITQLYENITKYRLNYILSTKINANQFIIILLLFLGYLY